MKFKLVSNIVHKKIFKFVQKEKEDILSIWCDDKFL
jgi:hypothetical protein